MSELKWPRVGEVGGYFQPLKHNSPLHDNLESISWLVSGDALFMKDVLAVTIEMPVKKGQNVWKWWRIAE